MMPILVASDTCETIISFEQTSRAVGNRSQPKMVEGIFNTAGAMRKQP